MAVTRLVYDRPLVAHGREPAAGVHVRRACPQADATALATVIEAVRDAGFPALHAPALLGELLGRPQRGVAVWLASVGDEPVGLVALVTADVTAGRRHSIAWLLVSPVARRRGVGAALVAAALGAARDDGAREVWVETRSDWTAADAFWRALGFRRVSAAGAHIP